MNPQDNNQTPGANTPLTSQPQEQATSADAMQVSPAPSTSTLGSSPEQPSTGSTPNSNKEKSALVALILSLFGIVFPILPIAAIIVGIVALRKIKRNQTEGKGMAVAAIVVSAFSIILQLGMIFLLFFMAAQDIQSRANTTQQSSSSSTQSTSSAAQSDALNSSAADATLRNDLIQAIGVKEAASGHTGSIAITKVVQLPKQGTAYVEEWTVEVHGVTTTYKIVLTPASDGGVDYAITEKK
jgi:hypothetical protein